MKKWLVIMTVDATVSIEVEANTNEEAEDVALKTITNPCLCHKCSRELDVGGIMDVIEVTEVGDE